MRGDRGAGMGCPGLLGRAPAPLGRARGGAAQSQGTSLQLATQLWLSFEQVSDWT